MTAGLVGQNQITTFTTPVNGTSPIDANTVRGNDNTIKTSYDAHDNDSTIHFQSSTNAARPAAGTLGRKWLDNDTYRVYYDDGAVWNEVAYLPTSGGTVSGNVTITGTLSVTGNFAVNTNKFNVTAASGNTTVAGTLGVTGASTLAAVSATTVTASGAITGTGGVTVTGNSTITGTLGVSGNLTITGAQLVSPIVGSNSSGASFTIAQGGSSSLVFAATTLAATFSATATATRVIGGTDVASAVAYATASDSTGLSTNDLGVANILGLLVTASSAAAATSKDAAHLYAKQTAANSGNIKALATWAECSHTSGTVALALGALFSVEASGNGGTTTRMDGARTQGPRVGTGATVTSGASIHVTDSPANAGTLTTLVGIEVDNITRGATNYAIKTGTGQVSFGDVLELTAAATSRGAGILGLGNGTQTTVGAAGGGTALPANPVGYILAYIGTTQYAIPYFNH